MPHSFTLHDLPAQERPRERLVQFGEQALSTQELLQLILGRGTKGESVVSISQKLLAKFGNLQNISEANLTELSDIKGIGLAKATQLKAVFEISRRFLNQPTDKSKQEFTNPKMVAQYIKSRLKNLHKEHFFLLCLDNRNRLIDTPSEISMGTLNSSLVHPREVFIEAIKNHATAVIIAHNHPSGNTDPSDADVKITDQIKKSGELLNIGVLDHVIIAGNDTYSFKSKGLI